MDVHVLVPAAGSGSRFGGNTRKQYIELGGRPLLVRTLERLAALPQVTAIHLIAPQEDVSFCENEIVRRYHLRKIGGVILGGSERQDSVRRGLLACGAKDGDIVMVHDGVRPFFPLDQIGHLLNLTCKVGAAVLAIPTRDTIKRVVNGRVQETLERSQLWQVQTPQAFLYKSIFEAHQRAHTSGFLGTDDASLVEWCGWPVAVLSGHPHNIKITTPEDLVLAQMLIDHGGEVK